MSVPLAGFCHGKWPKLRCFHYSTSTMTLCNQCLVDDTDSESHTADINHLMPMKCDSVP